MKEQWLKNLFILGAGASKPYGFPTGFELRNWLIGNITSVFDRNKFLKDMTLHQDSLENFSLAFNKSKTNSIDLFLSRNQQYEFIGKAGIADKIIECEARGFDSVEDLNDDWYFHFYNYVTAGVRSAAGLKGIFNDFSFITFNYDRSFEAFLSESQHFSFFSQHPSFEEIDYKRIEPVDILHIYGSLGKYPDKPYYGRTRFLKQVGQFEIDQLKTLYSERDVDTVAAERIELAERIFFIGFGYLPENMHRLGVTKNTFQGKEVYGTAFGSLDGEIGRISRYFEGTKYLGIRPWKSIDLLKTYL